MEVVDAAPPGRWSFVYPWCHVLRGRLHLEGRVVEKSSRWEYRWVVVRLPHTLVKANVTVLQRIREALDLLTRVAILDNAAWRALLVQQCRVPREEDDQPLDCELFPRFRFVFNENFVEDGALSPAAVCRRFFVMATTQRASSAYLDARRELQQVESSLGLESGYTSRDFAAVPVELQFELMTLQNDVLEKHLRDLSAILELLHAGRQATADAWSLLPQEVDSIRLDVGGFNAGCWSLTQRLTALLSSQLPFSLFAFSLKRCTAENYRQTQDNLGRLLHAVLCKQGQDQDGKERDGIETLSVGCHDGDNWQFAALCSAIGSATATKHIRLYGVFRMSDPEEVRSWKWQWLTYALFMSVSTVAKMLISAAQLSHGDVSAIATVLSSNCPPLLVHTEAVVPSSHRWDCKKCGYFLKGTECILLSEETRGQDDATEPPFIVLEADSWLHIVSDDNAESLYLDVVLPGFGIARVDRLCTTQTKQQQLLSSDNEISGLQALTLALGRHTGDNGGEILADFLGLVGSRLGFLAIYAVESYSIGMSSICHACPHLNELFLDGIKLAKAENLCRDAEQNHSQIARLGLVNALSTNDQISQLVNNIGTPTSHFAEHLSELNIIGSEMSCYVDEVNVVAILDMLKTNRKLAYLNVGMSPELHEKHSDTFQHHHGEPLAVVKDTLVTVSKAAFLSVVSHSSGSAVNALDGGVLSIIFSFAATCKTRVVRTHYM